MKSSGCSPRLAGFEQQSIESFILASSKAPWILRGLSACRSDGHVHDVEMLHSSVIKTGLERWLSHQRLRLTTQVIRVA